MRRYPVLEPQLDAVVHEQRRVLEAIRDGRGDDAEQAAVEHIRTFEREIRAVI
jgi:DNA-binding GntR family transcriptional regulator